MRYIRVIDLETTGLDPAEHGVCQAAYIDVDAESNTVCNDRCFRSFIDPGRPIPPEVSAIHHIIDDDVAGKPKIGEFEKLLPLLNGVLCAHNVKFDRSFLSDQLSTPWICTYKCSLIAWPDAPSHNNQALRYYLGLNVNREFANQSHRALPDAYVTAHILCELLKHYPVETLVDISSHPALMKKCKFGKHRGERWSDIPEDYLRWVLRQDFDEDIIYSVQQELASRTNV